MSFVVKHRIVQLQNSLYSLDWVLWLFSFLKWKFISKERFEDIEDIKNYMILHFNPITKKKQKCLKQWKTPWNKGWMHKKLFWRKLIFHSLFISGSVNTASDAVFLHIPCILKKMNVLFIVHFCLVCLFCCLMAYQLSWVI